MKPLLKATLRLFLFLTLRDFARAGYDPTIGRWLSRDPLENAEFLPDGPNLYAYVGNNPVNWIDPLGQNPFSPDSVSQSVYQAIGRGSSAEIESAMDAAGDILSTEAREAGRAAIDRLRSKAGDIIAKECKGSINREFPEQLRGKTLEEIKKMTDAVGKKAAKLLNDKRFKK